MSLTRKILRKPGQCNHVFTCFSRLETVRTISAKKPRSGAYPKKLVTIGDHLRKWRLDLELLQKNVAVAIGVDTDTITNWEKSRTKPPLRFIPKIIDFIGYWPPAFEQGIRQYRYLRGISQKELARGIGVDPTPLSRMERNSGRCLPALLRKVSEFLALR